MKFPMNKFMNIFNKIILILLVANIIFANFTFLTQAEVSIFTEVEREFISKSKTLKVVSLNGIAPLSYMDMKNNIRGIGINLLDEISEATGLDFEYRLYDSVSDALASDFDIFVNAEKKYAPINMLLSQPYLESEAVLFYNKSLDPKQLDNKTYAFVAGGTLPDGIKEDRVVYYNDRADTIEAVDSGKADYGHGNAYSLAFYTLQNSYENIITIPTGKEERTYCVGVLEGNEVLLSIINKSIELVGKNRIDALVLDVASQVERKVTVLAIINLYWREIFGLLAIVIAILAYSIFISVRSQNQIEMENQRYKIVAQISNEFIFEYWIKTGTLHVSEKFNKKIDHFDNRKKIIDLLNKAIFDFKNNDCSNNVYITKLQLSNGSIAIYKIIFSHLTDKRKKVHSVIGKFIDISEEEKLKEQLLARAQSDGLTGLYNLSAIKEAIINSMKQKAEDKVDALIIIDCDKFKDINDEYGHLEGNNVLICIAKGLETTFRQTDIIGRLGGDEFGVYMHDVKSAELVKQKCQRLIYDIQKLNENVKISISVGVAMFGEQISYEKLFQRADKALYLAKNRGGSQTIVYEEDQQANKNKNFN